MGKRLTASFGEASTVARGKSLDHNTLQHNFVQEVSAAKAGMRTYHTIRRCTDDGAKRGDGKIELTRMILP